MSLPPDRRAIAARMGALSREFEEKLRSNQIAQDEARKRMLNATDQNMELLDIFRRHNDAFAEFIDTITEG
jgi:hypothetical protein